MPTIQCKLDGFENVSVTHPDEWKLGDTAKYAYGQERALVRFRDVVKNGGKEKADIEALFPTNTELVLFGVLNLVEIDGLDVDLKSLSLDEMRDLPNWYSNFISWVTSEVGGSFQRSKTPPKNS